MARFAQLLALIVASISLVSAAPATSGRTQYAPKLIPNVWKKLGAAQPSASVSFTLVFNPVDASGLEERMTQIALSHGEWLSHDEVSAYFAPSADVKGTVESALKAIGATDFSYSAIGDKLTVTTTVEKAAEFFSAEFLEYSHAKATGVQYKTHQYTIPGSISEHIADVYPFATFADYQHHSHVVEQTAEERSARAELSERATGCSTSAVTSACIRSLYGFDTYKPTTSTGTARLGIMAYIGQNFAKADLATYLSSYRPDAAGYTIPVTLIKGALNLAGLPGVEAALDTQTAAGIIYPLPSGFYDLGTIFTAGDIFLLTFQYFLGLSASARPSVITISYGSLESAFTSTQANTMCTAAQQLSAQGMTIVVSSGDSGVGGQSGATCPAFVPTYPGGCPYILSVGATQAFTPEVMVDTSLAGFYSGAAFSNIFSTPSYQTSVVATYNAGAGKKYTSFYNTKGRAFPDVSAQGSRQEVVASGSSELVGGTSASAPITASGLTLLNDLLIKAGKATVGWANPSFYASASTFTDVTSGGSYACGSTSDGLPAAAGWDASAGLGTLSFSKLRTLYGV